MKTMVKNRTAMFAALCGFAGAAYASAPAVDGVTMVQDTYSRTVTIAYTLADEPAIVTIDVQTNGISIGGANLGHFAGDVNKVVQPGARMATWRPDRAWPGHKIDSGVTAVVTAWAEDTPPDVMVVSLVGGDGEVEYYADLGSLPGGVTNDVYKTAKMVFRKIPAADVSWAMGSPAWETGREGAREAMHTVTLTNDYYVGVYPVTQAQYANVAGVWTSSAFTLERDRATRPVEKISWETVRGTVGDGCNWPVNGHAVAPESFIGKLRTQTGMAFDLPTDAEWEFACRAGTGTALNNGQSLASWDASPDTLDALARYRYNGGLFDNTATPPNQLAAADGGTAKVGSYEPNAWGLYDMHGNVWEWCLDWYQESPLGYDPLTGPVSGSSRVMRGGSWNDYAFNIRSAARTGQDPNRAADTSGFRLALPLPAIR